MARALAVLAGLILLAGCGSDPVAAPRTGAPALRASLEPAAAADPAPRAEEEVPEGRHLVAHLERPVQLRSGPGGRVLARLATRTEFGSQTALNVVSRRAGWLEVIATPRPNGRTGWIPADAARLKGTDFEIRIDRSARRLVLLRGRRVLRRATVAIGRPANPTPLGRFAVTDRLTTSRVDSPYGCCAIALTGHQSKLVPGWPGGDRLAIHGTPQPETVGKAVSLGCLRARRVDLEFLLARLPLGTPVFVRA